MTAEFPRPPMHIQAPRPGKRDLFDDSPLELVLNLVMLVGCIEE
jgi:hypothetical protein